MNNKPGLKLPPPNESPSLLPCAQKSVHNRIIKCLEKQRDFILSYGSEYEYEEDHHDMDRTSLQIAT